LLINRQDKQTNGGENRTPACSGGGNYSYVEYLRL